MKNNTINNNQITIDQLDFSLKTLKCLRDNNILFLKQLEKFTEDDFINYKFNRDCVNEIIDKMGWLGYTFVENKKNNHFRFKKVTNIYIDEIKKRGK